MKIVRTSLSSALALVLGLGAWSCAQGEYSERADTTRTVPGVGAPSGSGAQNGASATGDTAGSAANDTSGPVAGSEAELRNRLRTEARRLDGAVNARNLDEVGVAALRVRDLVVALGGKTAGVPTRTADDLELQISEVTAVTEKIRGHAAAGEIDGVTAQNTALQGMITKMLKTSAQ